MLQSYIWRNDLSALFVISVGISMQWMGSQITWSYVSLLYTIQLMKWLLIHLRNKDSTSFNILKKQYDIDL